MLVVGSNKSPHFLVGSIHLARERPRSRMSFDEDVMNKPVRVEKIILLGLKRTKEEIVLRELENLKRSGTLEEIKDSILIVHANLMALGIFQGVEITIADGSGVSRSLYILLCMQSSAAWVANLVFIFKVGFKIPPLCLLAES